MKDVLEQLRATRPMPRGERLATWSERAGIRCCRAEAAARWALARERRRRERAEELADERRAAMHRAWVDEQATSAAFHERGREIEKLNASAASRQAENRDLRAERDALRAEVARLQPPTREEVERAVAELEEAYDALIDAPALDVAANSRHQAARAALVKLATRGKE